MDLNFSPSVIYIIGGQRQMFEGVCVFKTQNGLVWAL